ncbi:MAG TPA: NAD-dependent dehydratase, partial [Dehalococcoidia bacterium]
SPLREKLFPYRGQMGAKFDDYDKIPVEQAVLGDADLPGTIVRRQLCMASATTSAGFARRSNAWTPAARRSPCPMAAHNWRWSRSYAGNVADAIVLALTDDRAAGRIYNVAEPETLTQAEWTQAIADAIGWHGAIMPVPDASLPAHLKLPIDFRQDMVVDSSRIRAELGFRERISPAEGIRRSIEWERAQPQRRAGKREAEYAAEDRALASIQHEGRHMINPRIAGR